mmetsp:Transcript_15356/g.38594  ORF Transcript_15356/g.38594 Transcript_15356/m.38594 type:complete len:272 (-) Transcript_15356:423-1238(-)|eukprot:CAMPEP_0173468658 /NCGR_PEP_ID=MMETSP1357-20121228/76962_1 /TAXON_ID=77926 /ORGANISM="Hemiselmis rufescens, Strain PCC563" /LENGTH=271 /DNA_ID=CAMNT_0014436883 /DNA_START=758 /DNA_END=1573 /DNA_ORIENTATION=-
MAPHVSGVKVAAAPPPAAAAQPDPATMSARDRIRMHVQKNLQKQQQQQQQQQQQEQQQQARGGGGGASAASKKAQHGGASLDTLQLPAAAPARKRQHGETEARSSGGGSPTFETNTPPSGLSVEEEVGARKRSRQDDSGMGGSDGEDGDDFGDTDDGMPGPSPQQGMMAAGIDATLNESLGEMGGTTMFENPHEHGGPHERLQGVPSPGGAEDGSSGFDSPPCEVGWSGGEVAVEAASVPSAGPGGVVDDEWVKGLYDMEGLFASCLGFRV